MVRIAMAVYGDLTYDSRVQREANSLVQAGHDVTIACLAARREEMRSLEPRIRVYARQPRLSRVIPGAPNPHFDEDARGLRRLVGRTRWLVGYAANVVAWGWLITEGIGAVDVWHAHDLPAYLALATRIRPSSPVVYDVHDLFLETGTGLRLPTLASRLVRRIEGALVARAAFVVTVNHGLRAVLQRRYRPRSVVVVHNTPPWREDPPAVDPIRPPLGLAPDVPIVLYHGMLAGDRNLDRLAAAMLEPGLERAHLVLLGHGPDRARLAALAGDPGYGGRVHVCPSVSPDDLPAWIRASTVGAMPLPPLTMNLVLSTPNKLWECLAAGTPVLVSNFPAVRHVVQDDRDGPLGEICDPESIRDIARGLRTLVSLPEADAADLRRRCLAAARDRWNWGKEVVRLQAAYARLAATIAERPGLDSTGAELLAPPVARWKRALDVAIAAPGLLALAALIAATWLAMRLSRDPGPVLYRARRIGEGHREIDVYKLRTMRPTDGPALTTANDDRVTPVGRILRRYRLDEVPQLWNVLEGTMSLVGPRPEDPAFVDLSDPQHRYVFSARPGITGPAQLAFRNEAALLDRPDADAYYRSTILPRKLAFDRRYLESTSLRGDLALLVRTIKAVAVDEPPTELPDSGYPAT